jgi:hypothetical protein
VRQSVPRFDDQHGWIDSVGAIELRDEMRSAPREMIDDISEALKSRPTLGEVAHQRIAALSYFGDPRSVKPEPLIDQFTP